MSEKEHMDENISGIYNYCDRWCDKCSYTNRCLVFKKEAERNIKHILRDEDPNDPDVFAKDISDTFQETFDLIKEKMNEDDFPEFIDEDEFDFDDEPDFEIDNIENSSTGVRNVHNPLIDITEKLFKDFLEYHKTISSKYPDEPIENMDRILEENLDILSWHTPQIHVKARMCAWGKSKLLKSRSLLQKEIEEDILNVNSRIAYVGIENCIEALNNIYEHLYEMQTETLSLLSAAKK